MTDLFVIIVCYPGDLCVMMCYICRLQAVGTERSDRPVCYYCVLPGRPVCDVCVIFAGYKPWVQSEVTDLFVIIVIIVCYPGDLCVMSVLYLQATSRGYRARSPTCLLLLCVTRETCV